MATLLLNADAALVTIQNLVGHTRVRTTQRYCWVSNLKAQRDYQQAIGKVIQRHALKNELGLDPGDGWRDLWSAPSSSPE